MAPAIRLIATDVDGTLMEPGTTVPEGNRAALRAAAGRGVRVALATVRTRVTARRIVEELGVPCGLVCQGGAAVYDEDGRLLHEVLLPLDLARTMAVFADEQGLGLLTTIDGEHHWGPGYVSALPGVPKARETYATNLATVTRAPTRFMVTGERGVNLLLERFGGEALKIVRHYRADGTLLDAAITAAGGSKEEGLAALCRGLGIGLDEVLAIGDAEADIGMIREAGVGVAMGNADPKVRAVADWVAPPAWKCGVAAAVEKFVLRADGGGSAPPG
jgi:hydroxymethylpyrimidine pyrophosphatase-like HAD family hydrolase